MPARAIRRSGTPVRWHRTPTNCAQSSLKTAQKKVLSTMRGLLRHVATLRNKPTAVDVNDTSAWRAYVAVQYRAGAAVMDKVWRAQRLGVVACVLRSSQQFFRAFVPHCLLYRFNGYAGSAG